MYMVHVKLTVARGSVKMTLSALPNTIRFALISSSAAMCYAMNAQKIKMILRKNNILIVSL